MKKINLDSCKNIRDISYKNIIPGKLIRSSSLNKISDDDLKSLILDNNIKTIIDLRSFTEIEDEPDKLLSNVTYYKIPLADDSELGLSNGKTKEERINNLLLNTPNMCELYKNLVTIDKKQAWEKIFNILLQKNDGAILWHCQQGKDRCGIVSAILEYALGIDYETILEDYLLSNEDYFEKYRKYHKLVLQRTGNDEQAKKIAELFLAKKKYLDSAINYINFEYGSISTFLNEICGLTNEKIKLLKQIYLK